MKPAPRRELPVVSAHHAFEEWDQDALGEYRGLNIVGTLDSINSFLLFVWGGLGSGSSKAKQLLVPKTENNIRIPAARRLGLSRTSRCRSRFQGEVPAVAQLFDAFSCRTRVAPHWLLGSMASCATERQLRPGNASRCEQP